VGIQIVLHESVAKPLEHTQLYFLKQRLKSNFDMNLEWVVLLPKPEQKYLHRAGNANLLAYSLNIYE